MVDHCIGRTAVWRAVTVLLPEMRKLGNNQARRRAMEDAAGLACLIWYKSTGLTSTVNQDFAAVKELRTAVARPNGKTTNFVVTQ